jgi:hypothetical protein
MSTEVDGLAADVGEDLAAAAKVGGVLAGLVQRQVGLRGG